MAFGNAGIRVTKSTKIVKKENVVPAGRGYFVGAESVIKQLIQNQKQTTSRKVRTDPRKSTTAKKQQRTETSQEGKSRNMAEIQEFVQNRRQLSPDVLYNCSPDFLGNKLVYGAMTDKKQQSCLAPQQTPMGTHKLFNFAAQPDLLTSNNL